MKSKPNPDYLGRGNFPVGPSIVLMTDKELLEILDIIKELCMDRPNTVALRKVEKLEKKFKTNK